MLDGSYTYIQLCNLSQVLIYMYLPFATDPSTSTPMHLKAWFGFVAWSCKSCKSSSIFLDSKWVPHAKLPLTTLHPSTSSTIPVTSSSPVLVASNGVGRTQMRFAVFFFGVISSFWASDSCPEEMNESSKFPLVMLENQRLSGPVSWFAVLQLWLSFLEFATQTATSPCS